ncbi:ribonuclease P protein component [Anaerotalea alkaliphila]|uniref:Ribonuclease P protein component n=1 Tax=Anaerotalea alkaliphila TaxID=2662126 RepID=A0A7X5KMQ5_9FIRM|nr:ribonuclease P protein component [Anaerotalea alkaliphila]
MKNFNSIKKNKDFRAIYQLKKSHGNKTLVMYVGPNGLDHSRIGISVSRKVGNSVVRHRLTRLVREVYRKHENALLPGWDLVVVLRETAAGKSLGELESAFLHLAGRHKLWKREEKLLY